MPVNLLFSLLDITDSFNCNAKAKYASTNTMLKGSWDGFYCEKKLTPLPSALLLNCVMSEL